MAKRPWTDRRRAREGTAWDGESEREVYIHERNGVLTLVEDKTTGTIDWRGDFEITRRW